jgi:hypothetical protein
MVRNRTSPKKPLIAALGISCLSLLHAFGYRGKLHPAAEPLGVGETVALFVAVFIVAFPLCYLLRMLGVHMGAWGGKEHDALRNPKIK